MRQLFEIFDKAYLKSSVLQTAVNGFKKPGIYPFKRNVFTDADFAAANDADDEGLEDEQTEDNIAVSNIQGSFTDAHQNLTWKSLYNSQKILLLIWL